jgi:serine protease Do
LIAVSSLVVGMVIASRLDLTPVSSGQTFVAPPANNAPVTGPIDAQTFRKIASTQSPMVVNIRTETTQRAQDLSEFFGGRPDDLFRRFFGQPPGGGGADPNAPGTPQRRRREQTLVAAGTGFIISADGLILTNNHVVEDTSRIQVGLYGEEEDQFYDAKIIGRDQLTDSALIQLTQKPDHTLPVAKFGDSSQMAPGDWVMAIGNPFNLAHTVSVGVISAVERTPFDMAPQRRTELLQTDAAINPGNSGGPLLNVRGEVIGVNTAIISNGQAQGNIGIGFAVPINTVRELLPQLYSGKVVRGRIGVAIGPVPREAYEDFGLKSRSGALVSSVAPGGAAAKAGVEPGDVIIEYDGKPVPNSNELVKMVTATKPGTSVPIRIIREKAERSLTVVVDELDLQAEQAARQSGAAPAVPGVQGGDSFGLSLENLTAQQSRQLQLPTGRSGALVSDVDPNGPSARALRPGDVILEVNRQRVSNAAEAGQALQQVPAGRFAQILVWRDGGEAFVTVRKD